MGALIRLNIKAGLLKKRDGFAKHNVAYASPFVSLGDRHMVADQLYTELKDVLGLNRNETSRAVAAGYKALDDVIARLRQQGGDISSRGAQAIVGRAFLYWPALTTWTPALGMRLRQRFKPVAT